MLSFSKALLQNKQNDEMAELNKEETVDLTDDGGRAFTLRHVNTLTIQYWLLYRKLRRLICLTSVHVHVFHCRLPPAERRGYTSVFNALFRIGSEEGVPALWTVGLIARWRHILANTGTSAFAVGVRPHLHFPQATIITFLSFPTNLDKICYWQFHSIFTLHRQKVCEFFLNFSYLRLPTNFFQTWHPSISAWTTHRLSLITPPSKMTTVLIHRNAPTDSCHNFTALT